MLITCRFYFLLVFVFGTIPAGLYAKQHYNSILANVDYLHGSAESLLTITNLLIGTHSGCAGTPAAACVTCTPLTVVCLTCAGQCWGSGLASGELRIQRRVSDKGHSPQALPAGCRARADGQGGCNSVYYTPDAAPMTMMGPCAGFAAVLLGSQKRPRPPRMAGS